MSQNLLIVTNNPRVQERFHMLPILSCSSYQEVLEKTRDRIHTGAALLTHPLAGSVKPGESPYRSVAIDDQQGGLVMKSLEIIEQAIDRFNTLTTAQHSIISRERQYSDSTLADFQLIDFQLLCSGIEAIDRSVLRKVNCDD